VEFNEIAAFFAQLRAHITHSRVAEALLFVKAALAPVLR
jgi:hypothetical protein